MKIPARFEQFEEDPALMLVTSKREAALYKAHGGAIEKIRSFYIARPENTDKEGVFKARSDAGAMRSGSSWERNDSALIRDFMSEMRRMLKETLKSEEGSIHGTQRQFYLFAPAAVKGHIQGLLQKESMGKFSLHSCVGNYMHNHELDLLGMISEKK